MLNSGSCDAVLSALQHATAGYDRPLPSRLPLASAGTPDPEPLAGVSRDFASTFYSALVKEMQVTVREEGEEDSALGQSVQDFVGMFLPKALAGSSSDALAGYIQGQLGERYGEHLNECA